MKTCVNCEALLNTPLDEFGPVDAPLCRGCHLDPHDPLMDGDLLCAAEQDVVNARDDLTDQLNIIDSLERNKDDFAMAPMDYQRNLEAEQRELRRLQDCLNTRIDHVTRIKDRMSGRVEIEKRLREAWGGKV